MKIDFFKLREMGEEVLKYLSQFNIDFGEIFFEEKVSVNVTSELDKIKESASFFDAGAGIRVFLDGKIAYSYTSNLSLESLMQAAKEAVILAETSSEKKAITFHDVKQPVKIFDVDMSLTAMNRKIEILKEMMDLSFTDNRIIQANNSVMEIYRKILVMNTFGEVGEDEYTKSRIYSFLYAKDLENMQVGVKIKSVAGNIDLIDYKKLVEGAKQQAINLLSAKEAPAGIMPVVVAPGQGAIVFHEACGHGLEADLNYAGNSVYSGKIGEKVASELVTFIDDGTIKNSWGSFNIDDEGVPAQKTILIENGILKNYMTDRYSAYVSKDLEPTGSGRRESYKHYPIARMRNTLIAPGKDKAEDIIADTKKGLYVKSLGGGQVDIATGEFVFSVREGYLIENGKITQLVKGATLTGSGPEVLLNIDAVADDFALDEGGGVCGKSGQGAFVNQGQPTLRIKQMVVGGTKA